MFPSCWYKRFQAATTDGNNYQILLNITVYILCLHSISSPSQLNAVQSEILSLAAGGWTHGLSLSLSLPPPPLSFTHTYKYDSVQHFLQANVH